MSISYVCFRQHKASCHLILVLVCTFPINLPYSTGKKGKALLHIFFVCLFVCLEAQWILCSCQKWFPCSLGKYFQQWFSFLLTTIRNDYTELYNGSVGRSESIKHLSLGKKSRFIKYITKVYVSGTQDCSELVLGHRLMKSQLNYKKHKKGK